MNLLRVLVLFFLFSCEDNFQEIQNINNKNILPLGVTQNLKLIYTDSAKVKAILYSSLNKDYTNKPFPYSEFPNGIKISFFDDENNETIVTSQYAIMYNKTNIVDMKGKRMVSKFGNCFGRKELDDMDSEEMDELSLEEEEQYETLGTIKDVVYMSFKETGIDSELVGYALGAVKIGLIKICSADNKPFQDEEVDSS